MTTPRLILILILILTQAGLSSHAVAESTSLLPQSLETTADVLSVDAIQREIEALQTNQHLTDEARARLIGLYETALKKIQESQNNTAQTRLYEKLMASAPAQLAEFKKKIVAANDPHRRMKSEQLADASVTELEQQLSRKQADALDLSAQLERLENQLRQQRNRPADIRLELNTVQDNLTSIQSELTEIRATSPALMLDTKAHQTTLQASEQALTAEIHKLNLELQSQPPRVQLLKAQSDWLVTESNLSQNRIDAIQTELERKKESETERLQKFLNQTLLAAADKHPVIQATIRDNIELGDELGKINTRIEQAKSYADALGQQAEALHKTFNNAKKKQSSTGLNPALGALLRKQRRELQKTSRFTPLSEVLQDKTADVSLKQYQIEEKTRLMGDAQTLLEQTLALNVNAFIPERQRQTLQSELTTLFEQQQTLLVMLNQAYTDYLELLDKQSLNKKQLVETTRQYAAFLDEHLLWVASAPPVGLYLIDDFMAALHWFLSPARWLETLRVARQSLQLNPLRWVTAFAVIFVLITSKPYLRKKLAMLSAQVIRPFDDRFIYTLQSLLYIILLSTPLALFLYCLGWLLRTGPAEIEFSRSVGYGLCEAAIPLFFLELFYKIFRFDGFAELHFRWKKRSVNLLRRQLVWLRFVIVPAVVVISMTGSQTIAAYSNSLGRATLILMLIVISVVLGYLLRPKGGVFESYYKRYPQNWLTRLRYPLWLMVIVIPLDVVGFAVTGYYDSALELEQRLIVSIRACFIALMLHELGIRWLLLANRQIAWSQAREKRQAQTIAEELPADMPPIDISELDIPTINAQTRQLLQVLIFVGLIAGLWLIWQSVLPALAIFEKVSLWQQTIIVAGVETSQPVTLANLGLALLYLFLTLVAIRNLPGVLEIALLKRLTEEPGSRYATNQLIRYLLIALAIICITKELGGSWSQLQWLVAALSVGLGFGLQEIFANFVSGIIILFERPLRVGDTVTVDDMTGIVNKVEIRATTIVGWNRKELVVPNKRFITGQFVNWSLSDSVTRLLIPVGIAYGSDTELALKVILEAVNANPMVLETPEATVLFLGFGDSSLNIEVRVFVSGIVNRLQLKHELHMAIDKTLRKHHIEIPFPQRDLHIR